MSRPSDDGEAAAGARSRKQQDAARRKARLEASLRQNLARRKAQSRGRAATETNEDRPIDD